MSQETRMSGAELRARREYLGLTGEALARLLGVNSRTERSWEQGRDPAPLRLRAEISEIEAETDAAVAEAARGLTPGARIPVWRSDEEMAADVPDLGARWTARWWRHVARRAAATMPDVTIDEAGGDER